MLHKLSVPGRRGATGEDTCVAVLGWSTLGPAALNRRGERCIAMYRYSYVLVLLLLPP